ncbi:MAG: PIN domain-containing protein [Nanoarchaeota archaeon]
MKCLIDAYGWIEYLEGSSKGEKVNKFLEGENEIFVLPITIAEVVSKVKRKEGNSELAYNVIISRAKIIEMTPKVAKSSGLLHAEMRKKYPQFGIVDTALIETAKIINAKIITGDNHFKSFKEAIII